MTDTAMFLTGVGVTAAAALLVVLYLRGPLDRILIELCGTAERARFWSAFSIVSLVLVPLICALDFRPDPYERGQVVLMIATQLKRALVGLVTTAAVVAFVLSRFIPRNPAGGPAPLLPAKKSQVDAGASPTA